MPLKRERDNIKKSVLSWVSVVREKEESGQMSNPEEHIKASPLISSTLHVVLAFILQSLLHFISHALK